MRAALLAHAIVAACISFGGSAGAANEPEVPVLGHQKKVRPFRASCTRHGRSGSNSSIGRMKR